MNDYPIYLDDSEISSLQPICKAIKDNSPLSQIIQDTSAAASKLLQPNFAQLYAGILMAKYNRITEALEILKPAVASNTFARILCEHLILHHSIQPMTKAFSSTSPYDAWMKTRFYHEHKASVIKAITAFAKENPPDTTDIVSILDIGTGNGVLIAEVTQHLIQKFQFGKIRLVLIDQSPEMLKNAKAYCETNLKLPLTIDQYCARIEEMTPEQFNEISKGGHFWFINASASLHHMPHEKKIQTLSRLKNLSKHLLITEFEANNDLPEEDTPEFIYSTTQHYRYFFDDIEACSASEEEKKSCISEFLLVEALTMLTNNHNQRIDYHAPCTEWIQAAQKSGYTVNSTRTLVSLPKRAMTFFLALRIPNPTLQSQI